MQDGASSSTLTKNSAVHECANLLLDRHVSRADIVAFFSAVALYLSSLEYLLPRPVPFFRFGLANIAVLLALRCFTARDVFIVVMLKILGLGILNGTIASYVFVFSLSGSITGAASMLFLTRCAGRYVTAVGVSVAGALCSNLVQIIFAVLYVFGRSAWVIAPYLLTLGVLSGALIGMLVRYYESVSSVVPQLAQYYDRCCNRRDAQNHPPALDRPRATGVSKKQVKEQRETNRAALLLLCGAAAGVAYALTDDLASRAAQVVVFFVVARSVKRVKMGYFITLVVFITFFYALVPSGKVLFSLGSFTVTLGALRAGLFRSLTLCGYVFLSLWCVSPAPVFPGAVGKLFSRVLGFYHVLWYCVAAEKKQYAHCSLLPASLAARSDAVVAAALSYGDGGDAGDNNNKSNEKNSARAGTSCERAVVSWWRAAICVAASYVAWLFL